MAGISNSFSSEKGSDAVGSLDTCNLAVGGSDQGSPFLDAVFADEFHSNNEITADEFGKLFEEGFSL